MPGIKVSAQKSYLSNCRTEKSFRCQRIALDDVFEVLINWGHGGLPIVALATFEGLRMVKDKSVVKGVLLLAQNHILLAVRKRLAKRGYRDIHIKQARNDAGKVKPDVYVVSAVEPLSGSVVSTERSVIALNAMMR